MRHTAPRLARLRRKAAGKACGGCKCSEADVPSYPALCAGDALGERVSAAYSGGKGEVEIPRRYAARNDTLTDFSDAL